MSDEEKLKKEIEKGKTWTKSITKAKDFKVTQCPEFNAIRDYRQDNASFLLIRVDREKGEIAVGVCNYNYELLEEFRGKSAQQIYFYMLNNRSYITKLDHAAYLGKELRKAEMALKKGEEYLQE